jgi:protein ImuB
VLWIALHLPLLSLEAFAATWCCEADVAGPVKAGPVIAIPMGLLEAQRITCANAAALALGVKPGLKRATALALAPRLVLGQANAQRDAQALQAVAHAALTFTPGVAIQPAATHAVAPDTVVLDVERCLRYFGGIEALMRRLHTAVGGLGHRFHSVAAPTAQGAAMLARVHEQLHCQDFASLHAALDAAPVWLLGPGREHWEALQGMGLRTLADLRRLPRAGVARRFGAALLTELDRARGEQPDPREPIVLPAQFNSRLELFARADTTEQVLHGAAALLARLTTWLAAQHAQVRRFTLLMHHEPRWRGGSPAATPLTIALAEPSRDPVHLLVLLRERLGRLELAAPTLELQLQADEITQREPPNNELFPLLGSEAEGLTRLVERLQARLGHEKVQRLMLVDDHRPERASPPQAIQAGVVAWGRAGAVEMVGRSNPQRQPSRGAGSTADEAGVLGRAVDGMAPRPVWLLQIPEPLPERQSRPWLEGKPLQLVSGPERIESGWWDADLAGRDYFIAQAGNGALVWIYRNRLAFDHDAGWFLHGRFG